MSPIRVFIADDQALVRGVLAALLGLEGDLKVIAQVGRGDKVLDTVRKHAVDVALADTDISGCNGLTMTAEVVGSDLPCRCLIATAFGRPDYLLRGMEAGAAGFIVKDIPPKTLAEAIRKVHVGLWVADSEFAQESVPLGPNPLAERGKEVPLAAAMDADAREIATRLSLGEGTVRSYLSSTIAKTHTYNRTGAARTAETSGWL